MANPLTRQDIWGLQEHDAWEPVTLAYALAIREMQSRDASDPTSWTYQASVHGVDTGVPPDVFRNQCQHNTWYFLPWHRMYLYWFERIVRSIVAGLDEVPEHVRAAWALPYWNYSRGAPTDSLPPAFREETLPDGSDNPLFVSQRSAAVNAGGALHPLAVTLARTFEPLVFATETLPGQDGGFGGSVTDWHFFNEMGGIGGSVEGTPHNTVHGQVGGPGGLMSGFDTAPLDPVFWLHHCNIDRLWTVWLTLGDGRANPADARWNDSTTFHFHDEQANEVSMTPRNVLDTSIDLGYTYDDLSAPAQPERMVVMAHKPSEGPKKPAPPPELVGATGDALELAGDESSVDVSLAPPARPELESLDVSERRVLLNVENIEGDVNPGVSYGVYVNLSQDDAGNAETHYVGNVSFFGIEVASAPDRVHPGGHGLRHSFDITGIVRRLREQGRWDPERVRVTFSPLRPARPPGVELEAAETTPPVRIGRISIFYE